MASGKISGLDPNAIVRFTPPQLTVKLDNLYPRSSTFVRIRSNGPVLRNGGAIIPDSMLVLDQEISANRLLTVSNYGGFFDSDGAYVLELLTTTPFGTDILDSVAFRVNRTMTVNSMIVDGEAAQN
jgi:hypothetical protein